MLYATPRNADENRRSDEEGIQEVGYSHLRFCYNCSDQYAARNTLTRIRKWPPAFLPACCLLATSEEMRFVRLDFNQRFRGKKSAAGYPSGYPRMKPNYAETAKSLKTMVGDTGIEPVTPRV